MQRRVGRRSGLIHADSSSVVSRHITHPATLSEPPNHDTQQKQADNCDADGFTHDRSVSTDAPRLWELHAVFIADDSYPIGICDKLAQKDPAVVITAARIASCSPSAMTATSRTSNWSPRAFFVAMFV